MTDLCPKLKGRSTSDKLKLVYEKFRNKDIDEHTDGDLLLTKIAEMVYSQGDEFRGRVLEIMLSPTPPKLESAPRDLRLRKMYKELFSEDISEFLLQEMNMHIDNVVSILFLQEKSQTKLINVSFPFLVACLALKKNLNLKYYRCKGSVNMLQMKINNLESFFKFINNSEQDISGQYIFEYKLRCFDHFVYFDVYKDETGEVSYIEIDSTSIQYRERYVSSGFGGKGVVFAGYDAHLQYSNTDCMFFSLSFASKAAGQREFFNKLHKSNLQKLHDSKQKDLIIPKDSLPPLPSVFYKHAQSQKMINNLSDNLKTQTVNKRGHNLQDRLSEYFGQKSDMEGTLCRQSIHRTAIRWIKDAIAVLEQIHIPEKPPNSKIETNVIAPTQVKPGQLGLAA